ncbi:hypothetical protein R3P38DRAFT_3352586 [Favolaschia claudopus]|uniref:Uncharacterized protein n=1 Tax=Favolaschia claudopus TaxID=2862362 RepID=A0AAW0C2S0_9AGAR
MCGSQFPTGSGSAGFSRLLSNIYPTSLLAALNFPALHYSRWLESAFDWCCVPEPEFKLSRFLASRNFGCFGVRTAVGFALSNATRAFCNGNLAAGRLIPPSNSYRNANISTPRALSLRARREAAHVALTIQNFIRRGAHSGKNRPPDFKQRVFPLPHELRGSSRTRGAAARSLDYIEVLPASDSSRQKPLSILKAAGFPLAPRAFQLVEDVPRSGAIVSRERDPGQKPPLHTQSDVISPSQAPCGAARRRQCLKYIEFVPGSGSQSNSRPFREFDFSPSGEQRTRILVNLSFESLCILLNIQPKIENSRFRRPPSAEFMQYHVRLFKFAFSSSRELGLEHQRVSVLAQSDFKFKISKFTQNPQVGRISRQKEYLEPYT